MERDVVIAKIESLKRCIDRIRTKTPSDQQLLFEDWDIQDIIVLNLERAVMNCVYIASFIAVDIETAPPQTMAESFQCLRKAGVITAETADRMKKSVGFRNIAVQQYQSLDWEIVYKVITRHIEDFIDFADEILLWMDR